MSHTRRNYKSAIQAAVPVVNSTHTGETCVTLHLWQQGNRRGVAIATVSKASAAPSQRLTPHTNIPLTLYVEGYLRLFTCNCGCDKSPKSLAWYKQDIHATSRYVWFNQETSTLLNPLSLLLCVYTYTRVHLSSPKVTRRTFTIRHTPTYSLVCPLDARPSSSHFHVF